MSLINQMLKDLEQRRAIGTAQRDRVLEGLRPAATRQGSDTVRVLGMLAVVLLSGAAVLWSMRGGDQPPDTRGTLASAPASPATAGERADQIVAAMPEAAVQEGQWQNAFDASVRPAPNSLERHVNTEPLMQGVAMPSTMPDAGALESSDTMAVKSSKYAVADRAEGTSGLPDSRRENDNAEKLAARNPRPEEAAYLLKASTADSTGRTPSSSPKKAELHVEKRLHEPSAAERADAIYHEGAEKLRAGRRAQAEARWREALALDVEHVKAREALAGLLIAEGRGSEAGALLDEGLRAAPTHALFAKLRARLLVDEGNVSKALEVLEQHQPGTAIDPEYRAFQAALHQRTGQYAQAIAAYQRALAERPREAVWWMGLAIALEGAGNDREALGAYRRALAGGPLAPALVHYIEARVAALEQRQVDA